MLFHSPDSSSFVPYLLLRAAGRPVHMNYDFRFQHLHHKDENDGGLLVHDVQASIEREKDR